MNTTFWASILMQPEQRNPSTSSKSWRRIYAPVWARRLSSSQAELLALRKNSNWYWKPSESLSPSANIRSDWCRVNFASGCWTTVQLIDFDRLNNSLTKLRDKKEKSLNDESNLFKVAIPIDSPNTLNLIRLSSLNKILRLHQAIMSTWTILSK